MKLKFFARFRFRTERRYTEVCDDYPTKVFLLQEAEEAAMMEEEKLRMKEEQGSDYEDEEDEPLEEVELKKDSESSLKKSSSDGSCDSCEGEAEKSDGTVGELQRLRVLIEVAAQPPGQALSPCPSIGPCPGSRQ